MQLLKLKDVCSVNSGISPPKDKKIFENGTIPFYKTLDVGRVKAGDISDSELKVSQEFADSKRVFEPGTILFPKSGASTLLNHRVMIQKKGLVASTLAAIVPIKDLCLSKYLYYYLLTIDTKDFIPESFYPGMKISEISEIPIPVPSLQEQEKIVERLDLLNKKIKIKRNITAKKIFNLELMINSYINKFFQHSNVIKNTELGNVIETLTDYHANGSYKILKENVELKDKKDYAWMVRSTDFENNFRNKKKYITKPAYDFLSKSKIIGGELLMSKIGNAGKIYLMPKIDTPASLAMNLFLIRFNESILLNEYVYFFLSSHFGSHQIESRLKGATTQTITKDSVRSITIPLIPIKEQIKIIDKIKSFQINIDFLNKNYVKKDKKLQNLQFSLLERVFNFDQIGKSA